MKTIAIVGLGANGSHAATALRNAGALLLIDFDKVEQKNILSQMHGKLSLRRNKAQALVRQMGGMFGPNPHKAVIHKVDPINVDAILRGVDLVIDCTDNIAARTTVKDYCEQAMIPLMHAALSADGKLGRILWTELFQADGESGDGATCEDGENLPFHFLMGGLVAKTAQTYLTSGRKLNWQVTGSGITRL